MPQKEIPLLKNCESIMLQHKQIDSRSKLILWAGLYPVCVIAFAVIALLLFSEQEPRDSFWCRSELFFVRLIWFEILFSIGWFAGIAAPVKSLFNHRQQTGGGYLAIISSVLNATVLSMVVLFISLFFPRSRFYDNLTIVIQICILLFCIVKIFLLKYAQSFQVDGLNVIPANVKTPEQLVGMLMICEQQPIIIDKFAASVRKIKEKINYSLPKSGKIALSENYKHLANSVEVFYDRIMDGDYKDISSDLLDIERNIVTTMTDCKN